MKKLFFIAAIAGAALVSCTKNEVAPSATQQDEITFAAPVVGAQTKVYGAIGSTYNSDESFDVWCVHNTQDINSWGGTAYFSDIKATYNSTANGWVLTPKYYWPATGKLSFVALSPSIDKTTAYNASDGFTIIGFMQGNTGSEIVDLMYSDEVRNKEKALYGTDGDELSEDANSYQGVDIKFNHALSYLVFKIKTAADYTPTTSFKLNKITLSGVYTAGNFNQKQTDPWTEDTNGETGSYVAYINDEGLKFDYSAAVDAPAQKNEEIILLPQALTAGQQKITIDYKISTDSNTWLDQTQTVDITNTTVTAWEMGKKYTYTLSIGMQEIILDPAVADWTEGTAVTVTFN